MKGVFCLQHKNIKGAIFIPTNGNRDSRPGKVFACRIWNQGNFFGRIRNAGLWNPEFSLIDWNLKILSKFQRQEVNPVPGIQNEKHEIQNPRLSWITLQ